MMPEEMTSEETETFTAESEGAEESQEESADVEFSDETENQTDSNEKEKNPELNVDEENTSDENDVQEETVLFSNEEDFSSETATAERSSSRGIEDAGVLEPGNEYTVSLSEEDYEIWFSYTPEETGDYTIWSESDDNIDPYVDLYLQDEESEELSLIGYNDDIDTDEDDYDFRLPSELEEGRKYYYCITAYDKEGSFTIHFEKDPGDPGVKVPEIKSVSLKSYEPKNMSFIERLEMVKFDSCEVEVTYQDEQKETYSLYSEDIYGRELTWAIYDSNGELCDYDRNEIPAGDYKIKVSFGGVEADNSIDVKVTSLDKLEATDLNSGSADLGENDEKILKYKPSADGRYQFSFNVYVLPPCFSICAADGTEVNYVYDSGYRMFMDLKQDTEYYIRISTNKDVKVAVSSCTLPTKLKAVMRRKDPYIPGIDYVRPRDLQTEITYGDGTVRILNGDGYIDGYYLKYKIEERHGDMDSETIEPGIWHIVPYLSKNEYSNELDLEIETEAAELNVAMPEDDQFQNIKEDEWIFTGGEGGYYIFTPEEDGVFGFVGSEGQKLDLRFGGFYEKQSNGYESCPCYGEGSSKLLKDKIYLMYVGSGNSTTFKITKSDVTAGIEPIYELTLKTGMKEKVCVSEETEEIICTYTPEEDGYYEIQSEKCNDEYVNPVVTLYDDSGKIIATDGDANGGVEEGFRLISELSAGITYTYEIEQYPTFYYNAPFVLRFNKISRNAIKNADLVLKDGRQASDFRMDDDIWDVYELQIDYADGASRTFTSDSIDEFGNSISLVYDFSGNIAQDEIDCNISICYKNLGEKDAVKICKTVKTKAVGSFEEIELGKEYTIDGRTAYYKFIPEENGYYTYRRSGSRHDMWEYMCFHTIEGTRLPGSKIGKNTYGVSLQAGEIYYLSVTDPEKETLKLVKAKVLKGLEVVNAPIQKCLQDGADSIACGSLKLKAFYKDGSTEEIAYGERDSSGREITISDKEWLKNGKCRVYVKLGEYRASFEVDPASEDDIQTLTVGETNKIRASANDTVTLKFTPQKTEYYKVYITNGTVVNVVYGDRVADMAYYSPCRLKAGETYYIHITAEKDDPTVRIAPVCKTHTFSDWKTVKAATCTAVGSEMRECTVCGEQETRTTPALDHSYRWVTDKAATCTQDGSRHEECTGCKVTGKTEVLKATGAHKMGNWKVIKEATALSTGIQERTCSICGGAKETKSVAKLTPKLTLNTGINTTVPLKAKQTLQVRATGLAKGDKVASWKSSNTKIVTVSGSGKLTAKKAGTATVTVKLQSGLSKSFKVKVQSSAVKTTKISGLKSKVTVQKGKKLTLKPVISPITSKEKVTYSSSDKKIATVSSKGVITAKKAGTAKITVKSGSKKFTVKVTVPKTKTTALKASASVTVKKGKTVTLKVTKTPSNSDESITYASSDKKIATVDKKGKIKGVKKGTATITVKSGSISKKIKVSVK